MNEDKRNELLKSPIPKGGTMLDFGKEDIFILNPLNITVWKMAKKMIDAGQSTEAAVYIVDTLATKESKKASTIPETSIGLFLGLEQAVAGLVDPIEANIKKN